jgi:hypothetical protein
MLNRREGDPEDRRLDRRGPPHAESDWRGQEAKAARALPGGKGTPGSGCSRRKERKGDAVSPLFRLEAKTTADEAGIRVEWGWLAKITAEALPERRPVFMFGRDPVEGRPREDWIAFQAATARALMRMADALRSGDVDAALAQAELL